MQNILTGEKHILQQTARTGTIHGPAFRADFVRTVICPRVILSRSRETRTEIEPTNTWPIWRLWKGGTFLQSGVIPCRNLLPSRSSPTLITHTAGCRVFSAKTAGCLTMNLTTGSGGHPTS